MKLVLSIVKFKEPARDPRASVGSAQEMRADGKTLSLSYDTETRLVTAVGLAREEKPEVLIPVENVVSMTEAVAKKPVAKTG